MTRAAPRPPLHSSPLIRQLAPLAHADFPAARQSFAERIGAWLDVQDAISLSATLHPSAGRTAAAASQVPDAPSNPADDLARVRDALRDAIRAEDTRHCGRSGQRLPDAATGENLAEVAEFTLYHRYYVTQQRGMDAQITALRANLRAALAKLAPQTDPQLLRLALLDAALDKILAERERSLLASVPLLLERRFVQLRTAHRSAFADPTRPLAVSGGHPTADDPARWLQPGGWLARFRQDLQHLLLAELDLRLQPASGLVEAYRHATKNKPA